MNILVLDDNSCGGELLAVRLREAGHDASWEPNGMAGLAKLTVTPLPDAIIVDLLMPIMDGEQFLEAMAADARLCAVPALAISALGLDGLEQFRQRWPHVVVLQKPVELAELLAALVRVVLSKHEPGSSDAPPTEKGQSA